MASILLVAFVAFPLALGPKLKFSGGMQWKVLWGDRESNRQRLQLSYLQAPSVQRWLWRHHDRWNRGFPCEATATHHPDLWCWCGYDYQRKGAVFPVQDLLSKHGVGFDANNYISGVRSFYADSSGKMVGMPFNTPPVMYYNKNAFKKAGLTLPPATWEDFECEWPQRSKTLAMCHGSVPQLGFSQRISILVTTCRWLPAITALVVWRPKFFTTIQEWWPTGQSWRNGRQGLLQVLWASWGW